MIRILAIRVVDRIKESGNTQKVLTAHSDLILTRLGFHELNELICSREGYIVLHLRDDIDACSRFREDLNRIYGIEIKELLLCEKSERTDLVPESTRVTLAAIKILDRNDVVADVQKALTLFGCSIRTRVGVNLGAENSDSGLILLELTGDSREINKLIERLQEIQNACSGIIWFG